MSIPATPRLKVLLDAAATSTPPGTSLVSALNGKPLTATGASYQFQRMRAAAPIRQDLRTHDLRRTMATALYDQTKDLRAVQAFLGHKSLLSTVTYIAPHDPGQLKKLLTSAEIPLSMQRRKP